MKALREQVQMNAVWIQQLKDRVGLHDKQLEELAGNTGNELYYSEEDSSGKLQDNRRFKGAIKVLERIDHKSEIKDHKGHK